MYLTAAVFFALLTTLGAGHPTHRERCPLSSYQTVLPSDITAARQLQNQTRVSLKCHQGLRLSSFPECDIKGNGRLRLTLHRVSLAVRLLKNMTKSKLVLRNLELFGALHETLLCNTSHSDKVPTHPVLESCTDHLVTYTKDTSAGCIEQDILMSLVWLLIEDMRFLVDEDQLGREAKISAPQL
uniref:Type III interferon 1 n=1 Tax=Xenopus laevis TaxID=8355 RepID=A0A1B1FFV9_XENLA|nr:interferon-like LOC124629397 precursor [Xenopus laevis]ANQ43344.1 type III interferon 1 [Xenopus laevis]